MIYNFDIQEKYFSQNAFEKIRMAVSQLNEIVDIESA